MNKNPQKLDTAEIEKFELAGPKWWDIDGPLKTLHAINPLRLGYIEKRVLLKNARVLDVGCGGGILSEAMATKGANVLGIDMAKTSLDVARQHAAASSIELEYREITAEALADECPAEFDVVTCLELLEHVPEPPTLVAACAKMVRPGGTVFFSTINRNVKSFLMAIVGAEHILRMVPQGTHEYLKLVRPAELGAWCRQHNLDLRDITGLHFNPLTQNYRLGGNADVNYLAHTVRAGARE